VVIFPQHHVQTSLLRRFSRVWLCVTPQSAAHQVPPSLGFSRQEHWSRSPFPSPMHESEKWTWSHSVVSQLLVTPWTAAYQAPPSMGFSSQEYWSGVLQKVQCLLRQTSLKASNLSVTNSDKPAARPLSTSSNEWGETSDTYSGFVFPSYTEFTIQDKDKWEERKNRITERLIPGKQKGEVYSVVDKVLLKYLNAPPIARYPRH